MGRDGKYHQGRFNPRNPEKYKGDVRNIIYRSSWELKFLQWCDRNDSILEYGSEEFFIPYRDPTTGKIRRYFPDAYVKYKDQVEILKNILLKSNRCAKHNHLFPERKRNKLSLQKHLLMQNNCKMESSRRVVCR
jgi:hypothetical protein